jgi:hypothetical protein
MEDLSFMFSEENASVKEKAFYEKKFYFSYSSLNKLIWNPTAFYTMYVLGLKEERTDAHLVKGKIIHGLLLEEDKFAENFIISPSNIPADKMKIVIDRVFAHHADLLRDDEVAYANATLETYNNAIIDILADMNYHQSLKTDAQRLDKVLTPENSSYFKFLLTRGNRTLIDQQSYDFCKSAVDIIKQKPEITHLLGLDVTELDNVDVFNELVINCELKQYPFGLKGIVDNIKIDHAAKIIYVNDVKTSGKELKDFKESIEYYMYWLQAVFYLIMVSNKFAPLLEEKGYEIKFHFVVIDVMYQTYAFPISKETLSSWHKRTLESLEIAAYHYTNKRYDLPYAFDKGIVTL